MAGRNQNPGFGEPGAGATANPGPKPLTSREFWDARHAASREPDRPLPRRRHLDAELDRFFRRHLSGRTGGSVLEIGCGSSVWLPVFARDFGLRATGLDYSPAGLDRSRRILDSRGATARLVQGDVLDPALAFERSFDAVFSLGFIEHFEDPAAVLRRFRDFLAPGGILLTWVPHAFALAARLNRRLNPEARGFHIALDFEQWRRRHVEAGLVLRDAYPGQPFDFSMVNLLRFPSAVQKILGLKFRALSWPVLCLERAAPYRLPWPSALCAGLFFAAEAAGDLPPGRRPGFGREHDGPESLAS